MADPTDVKREEVQETFPVINSLPLRLSFVPDAIRDHFDGSSPGIEHLTDAQLELVGEYALNSDTLYAAFHEVLKEALDTIYNIDPEADDDVEL